MSLADPIARAAYKQAWALKDRAANPEKHAARLAAMRQRRQENPDVSKAASKKWREANKEKCRANTKKWFDENPQRAKELRNRWMREHPEYTRTLSAGRRKAIKERTPPWFSEFDAFVIEEAYSLAQLRTKVTGIKWHVDHVIPLRGELVSGLHVGINVAVIPASEHLKKANHFEVS